MKKYLFILASIFVYCDSLDAQYLKVPIGKKFKVVTQTSNSIEVTIQDQHQEVRNESMAYHDLELKAITQTGYTLELTPRRFKMNMNMMGMEQKMDTDSLDGMQGADLGTMKSLLNQPMTIVMDSNKLVSKTQIAQLPAIANSTDDASRYFLLLEASKAIQGYQWADSSISKDLRTVNHYTVMSVTATEIELNITTDSRINTVASMQGMEIKQNMKGFTTAKRWYNRNNGLLLKEESTTDMAGTTETTETSSPMTLKIVLKIVVEQ
jgi:hypothetical protein